jgi:hypothetical protein
VLPDTLLSLAFFVTSGMVRRPTARLAAISGAIPGARYRLERRRARCRRGSVETRLSSWRDARWIARALSILAVIAFASAVTWRSTARLGPSRAHLRGQTDRRRLRRPARMPVGAPGSASLCCSDEPCRRRTSPVESCGPPDPVGTAEERDRSRTAGLPRLSTPCRCSFLGAGVHVPASKGAGAS